MQSESFLLAPSEFVPNNPLVPVRLYREAIPREGDLAAAFEALFERNGWPSQWRNGVYPFHHYHSSAHEALGFASGWAWLLIGGPRGRELRVTAGDAVLLPAGTGHCRIEASADLLVVGAYPEGQSYDLCRDAADTARLARIRAVQFPPRDPVLGIEPAGAS